MFFDALTMYGEHVVKRTTVQGVKKKKNEDEDQYSDAGSIMHNSA